MAIYPENIDGLLPTISIKYTLQQLFMNANRLLHTKQKITSTD